MPEMSESVFELCGFWTDVTCWSILSAELNSQLSPNIYKSMIPQREVDLPVIQDEFWKEKGI